MRYLLKKLLPSVVVDLTVTGFSPPLGQVISGCLTRGDMPILNRHWSRWLPCIIHHA